MTDVAQLIEQLKAQVADLTYDGTMEAVTFDKHMAEIDLLIYEIRTRAFSKRPTRPRQDMSEWQKRDMDDWLEELSKEMNDGS